MTEEKMSQRKSRKPMLQKKLEAEGWRLYSNIPNPISNIEHRMNRTLWEPVKHLEDMGLQVRIESAYDVFGRRLNGHIALYSKARED